MSRQWTLPLQISEFKADDYGKLARVFGSIFPDYDRTPEEWRNFGVTLGPFESRELLVPSPDIRVWRLRLVGNQRATGINGLIDRLRDFRDFFEKIKIEMRLRRNIFY